MVNGQTLTRAAIVGTAPSWTKTPWSDVELYIASLNDAYLCRDASGNGIQRVDEWHELHPLDHFYYRKPEQKVIRADDVPAGYYVRPHGHIEWLKQQSKTIAVYLQQEPPQGFGPHARRLPLEELEAKYGCYWASGPAYMLMSLMDRGASEIHIYGIHLATQHEYIDQRPNMEFLLGRFLGRRCKETRRDGLRYYEGENSLLVLPVESPILQHGWKYAYQPKPNARIHPAHAQAQKAHAERAAILKRIAELPWWQSKAQLVDRMRRLKALEEDAQIQLQHAAISSLTVRAA